MAFRILTGPKGWLDHLQTGRALLIFVFGADFELVGSIMVFEERLDMADCVVACSVNIDLTSRVIHTSIQGVNDIDQDLIRRQ